MRPRDNKPFLDACNALLDKECAADPALRLILHPPWTFKRIMQKASNIFGKASVIAAAFAIVVAPAAFCWLIPLQETNAPFLYGTLIITVWSVLFVATRIIISLDAFSIPTVFYYVPLPPDEYRSETHRALTRPPWLFCTSLSLLFCSLAFRDGVFGWGSILLACGLTALCTLASWAAALWLARALVIPPLLLVLVFSGATMFLVSKAAFDTTGDFFWMQQFIERYGESFAYLTPAGWGIGVLAAKANALSQNWWYALFPLIGLSLSAPFAIRSLERRFSMEAFFTADWFNVPQPSPENPPRDGQTAAPTPDTADVDMEDVLRRWAPVCAISRVGWLERLFVNRCLSPQERVVLEHATLQFPRWTLWTLRTLGVWVLTVAGFALLKNMAIFHELTRGALAVVTFALALTTFPPVTGLALPTYGAAYPFSMRLQFIIRQKAAIARGLAIAPVYVALGYLLIPAGGSPIHQGILVVIKILLMATLGLPNVPLFGTSIFSQKQGCLQGLLSLITLIGFLFLLTLCAIVNFFPDLPPVFSLITVPLFIIVCWCWKRYFLWQYNRGDYG